MLINRAEAEREGIARLLDQIYKDTPPTDTLALNQVRAYRQDRIVAWQQEFDRLPKMRMSMSSDKGTMGGRRTAFNSVRAIFPKRGDFYMPEFDRVAPASVSEVEENLPSMPTMRRVTGDSFTSMSSASEASESESLSGPPDGPSEERSKDTTPPSEGEKPSATDATVSPERQPALLPPAEIGVERSDPGKSDPDSDSTIGAGRGEGLLSDDGTSPPQVRYPH